MPKMYLMLCHIIYFSPSIISNAKRISPRFFHVSHIGRARERWQREKKTEHIWRLSKTIRKRGSDIQIIVVFFRSFSLCPLFLLRVFNCCTDLFGLVLLAPRQRCRWCCAYFRIPNKSFRIQNRALINSAWWTDDIFFPLIILAFESPKCWQECPDATWHVCVFMARTQKCNQWLVNSLCVKLDGTPCCWPCHFFLSLSASSLCSISTVVEPVLCFVCTVHARKKSF